MLSVTWIKEILRHICNAFYHMDEINTSTKNVLLSVTWIKEILRIYVMLSVTWIKEIL